MLDERKFIAEIEAVPAERFAEVLRSGDWEQQRALRVYFGRDKYEYLHTLAQRQVVRRPTVKRGKVVILPGILGSALKLGTEEVWFGVLSIMRGHFSRLAVDDSGTSLNPVRAPALLRRYYGEIEQYLLKDWDVLIFPYDWRLSIRGSADLLASKIVQHFGSASGVHLVAHSMGGLVARGLAEWQPRLWEKMGQLIMLGTPNYGSLAIPQLYTGLDRLIRIVAALDGYHGVRDLLQVAKMFVGTYEMLPWPEKLRRTSNADRIFDPDVYGELHAPLSRFADARKFQAELRELRNPERMTYIAGTTYPTADGVVNWSKLDSWAGYAMTPLGDGTVPHTLGLLPGVRTYYVKEKHSSLPSNKDVLEGVDEILAGKTVTRLASELLPILRAREDDRVLREEKRSEDDAALKQATELAAQIGRMRGAYEGAAISPEEREIADLAFLGQAPDGYWDTGRRFSQIAGRAGEPDQNGRKRMKKSLPPLPVLKVHVSCDQIENAGVSSAGRSAGYPIDAISVGHYIGVRPVFAELALDQAISTSLDAGLNRGATRKAGTKSARNNSVMNGVVTEFTERGIIHGALGRPFLLADPRDPKRIIVIAGMGPVGRFAEPELMVLARELFWSLARLGKNHLATVLIGGGSGGIQTDSAVHAWLRGASLAIGSRLDLPRLREITFVERDEKKAKKIWEAVGSYRNSTSEPSFSVELSPYRSRSHAKASVAAARTKVTPGVPDEAATRILVEQRTGFYRFGAVSWKASFPERDVEVNPRLVAQVNDKLSVQRTLNDQREHGQYLCKLLVPNDVQNDFGAKPPIVLACDTNVAQLHWEMMVAPESAASADDKTAFLGLYPGVTRQLRNNFSGPPEPPPPSSRNLRVLIVADTHDKFRLPGAAAEGEKVKEIFEVCNKYLKKTGSSQHIEVEALIGPEQATCQEVLKRLLIGRPYDVLHYSGHCSYKKEDPASSGWQFSGDLTLSAKELKRVDQVPSLIFSNACVSGVMPSRNELRSPELAPSFAESFFERGVKNFVCTAWPVWDDAAAAFAYAFYSKLLGYPAKKWARDDGPNYIYKAMSYARSALLFPEEDLPTGRETWGAYQHYGNPWFKLF